VIEAAISYLEQTKLKDVPEAAPLYEDLEQHYRQRLASLQPLAISEQARDDHERYVELSRETQRIERETSISLRNEGRISDEVLRRIERELDLSESRYLLSES
jgi:monovalent cation/hydrogen antiporter